MTCKCHYGKAFQNDATATEDDVKGPSGRRGHRDARAVLQTLKGPFNKKKTTNKPNLWGRVAAPLFLLEQ